MIESNAWYVESTFERVDCVSFYNVCRKSVPKVYDPETEEIGSHGCSAITFLKF